jgi:microcystin degradation protein MlrC
MEVRTTTMRIAIGQVSHETNTFCQGLTTIDDFKRREWRHGSDIIAAHRGVRDDLGGMLDAAERLGVEVIPTFAATTEPSGTIARDAYVAMRDELLAGIRAAGTLDAVCLALHGAGVAEGIDDLEGELLGAVRAAVGPDLPVVVTLDLHGNITPEMAERATALLGCHLYPHTDSYERGVEAVELAVKAARGEVRPVTHVTVLPMMIPPSTTNLSPARDINELCWEWEAAPGIIDVAFFHGFPHTDVSPLAVSVVAVADGDRERAKSAADAVARRIWERRDEFLADLPQPPEAIAQALNLDGQPIVIAEVSDNSGGGSPADGTHLLRAMLDADLSAACFGFIYDPETAAQAHAAGVGATINPRLGGKTDQLHGEPIEKQAYVKCLTDGRFTLQTPMGRGARVDYGPMARLVIGGVDVLVGSERSQTLDAEVFVLHGIDVTRYKIVALKSQQHFRAGFEGLATHIIRTDPPGATSSDLSSFRFERLRRPIWPLDEIDSALL